MNKFTFTSAEITALEELPRLAKRYLRAEGESPFRDNNTYTALQSVVNYLLYSGGRLPIINNTGSSIAKGKAVALAGYDVTTGSLKVKLADKTSSTGAAIGVVEAALADGASGFVRNNFVFEGSGLNFAGPPSAGTALYLSTSGDLTTSAAAGSDLQQIVGYFEADVNNSDTIRVAIQAPAQYASGRMMVINKTGAPLAKGKAVAFAGYDATSGYIKVSLADNSVASGVAIGVLEATLADSATTELRKDFLFTSSGLDFVGPPAAGANLYLSTSGNLSTTPGTGANFEQVVAFFVADVAASDTIRVSVQNPLVNLSSGGGLITGRKDNLTGVAVTDTVSVGTAYNGKRVLAMVNSAVTAGVFIQKAEVAAGTLTVTFSAAPGVSSWSYLIDAR